MDQDLRGGVNWMVVGEMVNSALDVGFSLLWGYSVVSNKLLDVI